MQPEILRASLVITFFLKSCYISMISYKKWKLSRIFLKSIQHLCLKVFGRSYDEKQFSDD